MVTHNIATILINLVGNKKIMDPVCILSGSLNNTSKKNILAIWQEH